MFRDVLYTCANILPQLSPKTIDCNHIHALNTKCYYLPRSPSPYPYSIPYPLPLTLILAGTCAALALVQGQTPSKQQALFRSGGTYDMCWRWPLHSDAVCPPRQSLQPIVHRSTCSLQFALFDYHPSMQCVINIAAAGAVDRELGGNIDDSQFSIFDGVAEELFF